MITSRYSDCMTHPRQLLEESNIYAGKELGQNFLSDQGIARHIVGRAGIDEDSHVLEIGPGLGAITIPIAEKTSFFTAVEKDYRLVPILKEELLHRNLSRVAIINQDILKTDIRQIAGDNKLIVMGNVPYNISSQILFHLIQARDVILKAFLMFQKELADRIIAEPGTRDRSRLAAVAQYAAVVSHVMNVGPHCFFPRPQVSSTVLCFDFTYGQPHSKDMDTLVFQVIKAAFSKRRKALKNAMTSRELDLDGKAAAKILEDSGIDPQRRAETLSVEEFMNIALNMQKR